MMAKLNLFKVHLDRELRLWEIPDVPNKELKKIDNEFGIVLDYINGIAYPSTEDEVELLDRLGFKRFTDAPENWLKPFANLCRYAFIEKLISEGFVPIHENQNKVKYNRVKELYRKDKSLFNFNELSLLEGLRIGSYYFNPPTSHPLVALVANYTTTLYFTEPLTSVIDGVDLGEFYVQMKCDPFCDKSSCTFFGESRFIGKFVGFTNEGELCQHENSVVDKYVKLYPRRDGLNANPCAARVSMERNDPLICKWASEKYGKDDLKDVLDEARNLRDSRGRQKKDKTGDYYRKLMKLIGNIDNTLRLPNGQIAKFEKEMLEVRYK